ncbi:hypothetical protein COO60DRAFT_1482125 [Scenedesmus sp. NREL 46B-D3]|nr:hypothetical protein COO60DRAFT_1482125 [Scenedesmus sp. NREL 46B-D3]
MWFTKDMAFVVCMACSCILPTLHSPADNSPANAGPFEVLQLACSPDGSDTDIHHINPSSKMLLQILHCCVCRGAARGASWQACSLTTALYSSSQADHHQTVHASSLPGKVKHAFLLYSC